MIYTRWRGRGKNINGTLHLLKKNFYEISMQIYLYFENSIDSISSIPIGDVKFCYFQYLLFLINKSLIFYLKNCCFQNLMQKIFFCLKLLVCLEILDVSEINWFIAFNTNKEPNLIWEIFGDFKFAKIVKPIAKFQTNFKILFFTAFSTFSLLWI